MQFTPDGEWTPRGRVQVTVNKAEPRHNKVELLDKRNLTSTELADFAVLVKDDLFYRVRLRRSDAPDDGEWVMAPQKACTVHRANFREELKFHANRDGEVYALDYRAPFSPISIACAAKPIPQTAAFNSFATLSLPTAGAQIPTGASQDRPPMYIAQMLREGGYKMPAPGGAGGGAGVPGGAQGEPPKARQGFLRKYWYVILPLAIMSMSAKEPPAKKKAT